MSMLVQGVHVKNRCAFLNHSSAAMEFMQLVEQYPNIALWFSVSHLSREYSPAMLITVTSSRATWAPAHSPAQLAIPEVGALIAVSLTLCS